MKTLAERFDDKYVTIPETSCWWWIGAQFAHGYGAIASPLERKTLRAHRVSYELHIGPIPDGMVIMHSCDNPSCVNPEHLVAGPQGDNVRDCVAKGRHYESKKTHCKRGHEFTEANTYWKNGGRHRECRACWNERG
jgi:hypothetical protein